MLTGEFIPWPGEATAEGRSEKVLSGLPALLERDRLDRERVEDLDREDEGL